MRYIRTEYSFPSKQIMALDEKTASAHKNNPTFTALWMKTNTKFDFELSVDFYLAIKSPAIRNYININPIMNDLYGDIIDDFVDICLISAGKTPPYSIHIEKKLGITWSSRYSAERRRNIRTVAQISDDGIVIERSPPEWLSLSALAGKASTLPGISLAFVAVASNQWLLLVAIPGGIVLMGAATGIAKGLEAGLHHSIERYIKKKLK